MAQLSSLCYMWVSQYFWPYSLQYMLGLDFYCIYDYLVFMFAECPNYNWKNKNNYPVLILRLITFAQSLLKIFCKIL